MRLKCICKDLNKNFIKKSEMGEKNLLPLDVLFFLLHTILCEGLEKIWGVTQKRIMGKKRKLEEIWGWNFGR